jgi:hypothetical protein
MTTLYKKDYNGNILEWNISLDNDPDYPTLVVSSGLIKGNIKSFVIPVTMTTANLEIESRIKVKKSDGWLSCKDLKINENDNNIYSLLVKKLPTKYKDLSNRYKPQKAVLFKTDSFIYPAIIQRKINGVRCTIGWETITEGEGFFANTISRAIIRSKEGHEYVLPHITDKFVESDFKFENIELVYDGELYIHGKNLSYIRASIPIVNNKGTISNTRNPPKDVEFWTFDLSISDVAQEIRIKTLTEVYSKKLKKNNNIKLVESLYIYNDKEALSLAEEFIKEGFEGGILRNIEAEYAFGKRSSNMMKLKKWYYSKCIIIDILHKNEITVNSNTRTYISFILKNDLNSETFECTPLGDEEDRLEYLNNKDNLIGKLAQVKYRERSGIKKVPFQAVLIKILD